MTLTVHRSPEATSPYTALRAQAARALALFDADDLGDPEPIRGPIATMDRDGFTLTLVEPLEHEDPADLEPFALGFAHDFLANGLDALSDYEGH